VRAWRAVKMGGGGGDCEGGAPWRLRRRRGRRLAPAMRMAGVALCNGGANSEGGAWRFTRGRGSRRGWRRVRRLSGVPAGKTSTATLWGSCGSRWGGARLLRRRRRGLRLAGSAATEREALGGGGGDRGRETGSGGPLDSHGGRRGGRRARRSAAATGMVWAVLRGGSGDGGLDAG